MPEEMLIVPQKKARPVGFPEKMDPADFVGFMCQHFRVYHKEGSAEEVQWQEAIEAILSVYDEACLADVCLWFLQHRKEVRFPLPAEIIKVADAVMTERERPKLLAKEMGDHKSNPFGQDRTKLVVSMLRTPIGYQAIDEGWIGPLADYCRQHMEMPPSSMFPELRRKAADHAEFVERCYREDWKRKGGLMSVCARAVEGMQARKEELISAITGEVT